MKLVSFRVFNYKSIIDSKECFLSPSDGITVIAGQNESGKSSLLQALYDYEQGEYRKEAFRDDDPDKLPRVECVFDKGENSRFEFKLRYGLERECRNDYVYYLFKNIQKICIKFDAADKVEPRRFFGETLNEVELWFDKLKETDLGNPVEVELAFPGLKISDVNKAANEAFLDKYDDVDEVARELADQIQGVAPHILLFDDICDLLPDAINVADLKSKSSKVNGYQAVKNIEKILEVNFIEIDTLADAKRMQKQDAFKRTITAEFNQRWKQRIGNQNGAVIHVMHFQGGSPSGAYFKFFIETKEGELLEPHKRSQGFKWFLSFYLHLVAEDRRKNGIVILFDEPGLHLHSKAQADMLAVFEELSIKNQIIYSTHSPYLIDSNKLHRVRLIVNTNEGTKVEKLTTNAGGKTHDALKPIIDAIGLDMRNSFTPSTGGLNVIVEGISDFYYFKAFMYLLDIKDNIYFLPAMGAPNVHLLMELCMGWGLDWMIVFDEKGTKREIAEIRKKFFPIEDEINSKVYLLKGKDGIEDMFSISDVNLVIPGVELGEKESLGKAITRHTTKELMARIFADKVFGDELTLDMLAASTVESFKSVFEFISKARLEDAPVSDK